MPQGDTLMLEYSTLADSSILEVTEAWNRCWQGYDYELKFSEAQMKAWLHQCHVDLNHSIALKDSNQIIGFALLGVESNEGWIAGTSIDPHFRGKHLFSSLMTKQIEHGLNLGLIQLQLEVLAKNHAAKVYDKVGFQKTRELYIYRIPSGIFHSNSFKTTKGAYRQVSLNEYFETRSQTCFFPAWQRRENYLRRYSTLKAWLNSNGTSGMLFTGDHFSILLDAWTDYPEHVIKLVSTILEKTGGEFNLTNQPKDCITTYLTHQGISPSNIQYEMIFSR
jgi:ribosomal protein S18 acetylase RimI-like enzyme